MTAPVNAPLTPRASDPLVLKTMAGFPPAADRLVTKHDALSFPHSRWSLYHLRELFPTANVRADRSAAAAPLEQRLEPIRELAFTAPDGGAATVGGWLDQNYTDAFLVLRHGKIAYEQYRPGADPHRPHMLMSDTKSVVGLLAADLIARKHLDPAAPVTRYIPELEASGWAGATVQQTLDMTAGITYSESYTDPDSPFVGYTIAVGTAPAPAGYRGATSLYSYLPTLGASGAHGERFTYRTVNPEVIGWIIQRVANQPLADVLSERVWQHIGAENDAYFIVDSAGTPMAGGGLNATLRDVARFGDMVRQRGRCNGRQILEPAAFDHVFVRGYPVKLPPEEYSGGRKGYAYHNYWWLPDKADEIAEGWGICGQFLHINRTTGTVIVKHSSRPEASNNPYSAMATAAFAAIDHAVQE